MDGRVALVVLTLTVSWLPGRGLAGPPAADGPAAVTAVAATGVTLVSSVFGAGGAPAASPNFSCVGTAGQPTPVVLSTSNQSILYAGFWGWWLGDSYFTAAPEGPLPVSRLFPGHPNPFNPSTTIAFEIGEAGFVRLSIHDIRGLRLRRLVGEVRPAGRFNAIWDGRDDAGRPVASGLYICRLETLDHLETTKLVMIK